MDYEQNERKQEGVFSKKIKAGKRRTYFFDVRETRSSDYFLTITESRKRFNEEGYERHKIFLYKEDFNKFIKVLGESIDFVKTELMPDFDFDAFNHDQYEETPPSNVDHNTTVSKEVAADEEIVGGATAPTNDDETTFVSEVPTSIGTEEVEKW